MGQITGLRHLNISGCEALTQMPNGIKDLVQLQTLPIYIVPVNLWLMKRYNLLEKDHHKFARKWFPSGSISDLKHLNLRGLCWGHTGADFIMNPDLEANAARFQERKPPIPGPSQDPEPPIPTVPDLGLAWEVLECLQPHKNLKKLFIVGYPGIKFAQWTLPNLIELVLLNCQGCLQLPVLGHLPLLRSLRMEGLSSITHIGQEIYGDDVEVSFPSLQELTVRDFPNLQQWARLDGKETFPSLAALPDHIENLPSLVSLAIISCPMIEFLPEGMKHVTTLRSLEIRSCAGLKDLPEWLDSLTSLRAFAISDCCNLKSLPVAVRRLTKLQHLTIQDCPDLQRSLLQTGVANAAVSFILITLFCLSISGLVTQEVWEKEIRPKSAASSEKKDHMAIWNEVVSLVQDLDQLVSSYTHLFGRELGCRPLTEELQILDVTVCLMESLLGENRDHGFMNQILENRIVRVAQEAEFYIAFTKLQSRGVQFDVRTEFVSSGLTLTRITQEILSINEELKKIHDRRNVQEWLELTTSSTGKLHCFHPGA
ncbi:UNVERIFIED_CONTAM: hypothetical protein Slati_3270200 [Sesamum latifolium]|uniref:R13L1/DRL21-like LRR repeat region domain-containing protein n=1 Tax=Sesamum latifolium TaxID=2727402 RepID=A0AAW2V0G7_9LAMI